MITHTVREVADLNYRELLSHDLPNDPDLVTVVGVPLPRLLLDSGQSAVDQALAVDERIQIIAASAVKGKRISLEHCAAVHKNGPPQPPAGWPPLGA